MPKHIQTKNAYDEYGQEYMRSRDKNHPQRAPNDHMEMPAMVRIVGNIKGKKLLDVGCGAGTHIKKYLRKGAICNGLDISSTMIELARNECPNVEFKIGSFDKMPYKNNSFDVVTASLCVHYVKDMRPLFREVNRVLKKGGMFYYSTESPYFSARSGYQDKDVKIWGMGKCFVKRTGKTHFIGIQGVTRKCEWEMVPGMRMVTYTLPLRTHIKWLQETGFEFYDIVDCKPNSTYKKINPQDYELFMRVPLFSIYVGKTK